MKTKILMFLVMLGLFSCSYKKLDKTEKEKVKLQTEKKTNVKMTNIPTEQKEMVFLRGGHL